VSDSPVSAPSRMPTWIKGVVPLLLLAGLVVAFVRVGPLGVFTRAFPPVEALTVQRIALPRAGEMRVHVVNGGPEPVTVAQVLVDDAAWSHTMDGGKTLGRLQSRVITLPYPWVEGEPHVVTLVTSTGLTFEGTIPVATQTPSPDARYVTTFALLGLYAGVIPVFLGLLWFPFLRTVRREWLDFFLSLTIGLLLFLGGEALAEAFETAARVPGAFNGLGIILIGTLATSLSLAAFASLLEFSTSTTTSATSVILEVRRELFAAAIGGAVSWLYWPGTRFSCGGGAALRCGVPLWC